MDLVSDDTHFRSILLLVTTVHIQEFTVPVEVEKTSFIAITLGFRNRTVSKN